MQIRGIEMRIVSNYSDMPNFSYFGLKGVGDNDENWLVVGKFVGIRESKKVGETKASQYQETLKHAIIKVYHVMGVDNAQDNLWNACHTYFSRLLIPNIHRKQDSYYVKNKNNEHWAKLFHLENEEEKDYVIKCMMVDGL